MKIYLVTSNKNKFIEFSELLDNQLKLVNYDLKEIQTSNLKEIIEHKLKQAHKKVLAPVLVEDTSVYFEAWNGLPGPFIKWFLKNIGLEGLVMALSPFENKFANAKSCLGFTFDGKSIHFFEDQVKGEIVIPRGSKGFGWDSIFKPIGQNLTFSEMSFNEKLKISPRVKVINKFKHFLKMKVKQM